MRRLYQRRVSALENAAEDAKIGGCLGLGLGFASGLVTTVWGGYELGTAINNAIELESTIGRGALDLVVMGVIYSPVTTVCTYGSGLVGSAVGAGIGTARSYVTNLKNKIFSPDNNSPQ